MHLNTRYNNRTKITQHKNHSICSLILNIIQRVFTYLYISNMQRVAEGLDITVVLISLAEMGIAIISSLFCCLGVRTAYQNTTVKKMKFSFFSLL